MKLTCLIKPQTAMICHGKVRENPDLPVGQSYEISQIDKGFIVNQPGLQIINTVYVPRPPSYRVYISQLIRFGRVCSHVDDFNIRNKCLTAKLLKQGYQYHKLRKAFSKFYRQHYNLFSKFNVGLKSLLHQGLLHQGLLEPEFYGDLVYKFKKIRGMTVFLISLEKNNVLQTHWL